MGAKPSRRQLLEYVPTSDREIKICVYRNHSFELVEHIIGAYLDFAGYKASFCYSDYDDSLSFLHFDANADLLILWLDLDRYKIADVASFVKERIAALRKSFSKPVVFVPIGRTAIRTDEVPVVDVAALQVQLGDRFYDERLESATGTRLSSAALMLLSKELGLRYIPALLAPTLKAIVLDLDNTLYEGVLGEDGVEGVRLTEGHKHLQEYLKEKGKEGFFLCVASKNDARDVEKLFDERKDFPLRKEDFTVICASWDEKSHSVEKVLKILNVGADSLLFVDDNVGELAAMRAAFPSVKLLHASLDGEETYRMISYYPGLLRLRAGADDALRKADVLSNVARDEMRQTMSKEEYIRSLEMKLVFNVNVEEYAPRISELANKTNQFIFNYKRYDLATVEGMMRDRGSVVISAKLSDKLSDSGTIGVAAGRKADDAFILEECFVSCRALGRGIDDLLVLGMIQTAMNACGSDRLAVQFKKGERNEPAQKFVDAHLNGYLGAPAPFHYDMDASLAEVEIIQGR